MSTSYVIAGINYKDLLSHIDNISNVFIEKEDGNDFLLVSNMPGIEDYSLHKRIALAKMVGLAPDNVQQGGNKASVWLNKSEDENNSWFMGYGVSVNQPEVVLSAIVDYLNNIGIDSYWVSEHNDEYWELSNREFEPEPDEDLEEDIGRIARLISDDPDIIKDRL